MTSHAHKPSASEAPLIRGGEANDFDEALPPPVPEYRLYKRRFAGLFAVVMLNVVTGMATGWFGPITEEVAAGFGISFQEVNWLSNVNGLLYLCMAPFIPTIYRSIGLRWACLLSGALTIISAWLRAVGTISSLSSNGAYAILMLSQLVVGAANVLVEVMGPTYSQRWFSLKGRTTATMAVAVSNSVGTAIGAVIAPAAGSANRSILILAVISTIGGATALLVTEKPPTPPTFAASQVGPTMMDTVRALFGREKDRSRQSFMTVRQRIDFVILLALGGTLNSVADAFNILSAQILQPYGYSDTVAGLCATVLICAGLFAAILMSPLLDRVFMKHMGLVIKILCPFVGLAWLSVIWVIRPNNTAAILVIMGIIGAGSLTMLPVGLEMGVEVTRNPAGSAALLNTVVQALGVIFVQVESEMAAGPDGNPPFNMRSALIMNGVIACVVCFATFFIEGKQTRRELDEKMTDETKELHETQTFAA